MKTKVSKMLQNIVKISWWCVLLALAVLLVSIFGAKMSGKVPSVFGYSVINIISSSMEDQIPRGSYILIKKVEPEEVNKEDIICFYSRDPLIYGIPNTHRVIEDPIITEDGIEYVTKGDSSPDKDPVNAEGEDLIGVYIKTLDGVTSFSNSLNGNSLVIILIVLQLGIVFMFVYTIVVGRTKNEENESEK